VPLKDIRQQLWRTINSWSCAASLDALLCMQGAHCSSTSRMQ